VAQRSKNSDDSEYGLLRVYSYYRFALSLLLLLMYVAFARGSAPDFMPLLYLGTAIPYAAANLASLIAVLRRARRVRPRIIFLMLVLDIAALVLVTHASGGINSGFAVLLMVTVAAAAIFLSGQIATLVAAVASLAVLADAIYLAFVSGAGVGTTLFPAGLLGLLLFASSLLVHRVAERLRTSQEIAIEKTEEVIELQQLNQLIVQRMRTGILFIDGDDRVRITNQAAAQLLEISERDFTDSGLALPEVLVGPLADWQKDPRAPIRPFRLKEGGPLIMLNFTRMAGPAGEGVLVFAEDFTQITQQAQQLKLASLGRLTASIAHEIRNPLGSISHAAQLLRESATVPGEDLRLIDIVIANAKRTNDVIENVLTLSRGHQPRAEIIRLAEWLARFVDDLQVNHAGHGLQIHLESSAEDIEIKVDPTHLRQVLNNLCENGLRYSQRAIGISSLRLHASVDPLSGLARLDVIDQGEGIAEEHIPNIFEPFFTTEQSGTGLGLYLSRELCEANQIRLEYLRDAEHGSCFRLNFPHPHRRALASASTPSS